MAAGSRSPARKWCYLPAPGATARCRSLHRRRPGIWVSLRLINRLLRGMRFMLEGAIIAHKPGLGLGLVELIRADLPNTSHRLVLEDPEVRRLTIRDVDGKPIVGAVIAARVVRTEMTSYLGGTVPDEWLAKLSATTDHGGFAAMAFLPQSSELRSVRLAIPGHGTHFVTLPYQNGKGDVTLSLGHPARLAGKVENASGIPVDAAQVEVWVRSGVKIAENQALFHIPERVPLDGGPIQTDSGGAFQTPPLLLTGETYRVVLRKEGHSPALSDWITLKNESNSLSRIVMSPERTISGRVADRQGNAIRGVQIFEPAGGPSTTTDPAGAFRLERARSARTFVLARRAGFRLQGRLIDLAAAGPIVLIMSRPNEAPDRMMATLPELMPVDDYRALARRLIGPYQKAATAKGDDAAKFRVLDIERWLNPAGLLDQVQKTRFDQGSSVDFLRARLRLHWPRMIRRRLRRSPRQSRIPSQARHGHSDRSG